MKGEIKVVEKNKFLGSIKSIFNRKKIMKTALILPILGSMAFGMGSASAEAANIKDWNKTEVATSDKFASSKYATVAQFNSKKTKVTTFGRTFLSTDLGWSAYTANDVKDSEKGKIGAWYDYIGYHNGRDLSLKITVMDWKYFSNKTRKISFGRKGIAYATTGLYNSDLKWEFYYTDTKTKADMSGSYMNIIDIDALQGLEFDKTTTDNIEKLFVTNDSWIDYKVTDGKLSLFEGNSQASTNEDKFAQATVLLNKGSEFRFKWFVDYDKRGSNPDYGYPDEESAGEYFGFNGKKLVRSETVAPSKLVSDSDEKNKSSNTLLDKYETQTYHLQHYVNQENSEFYAKKYELTDTLPKEVVSSNFNSLKVVDELGNDRSSWFENKSTANKIHLVAKSTTLSNDSFYGHYYNVDVTVKLAEGVSAPVSFKNVVSVTKDSDSKTSNEVTTNVKEPKIPAPLKKVSTVDGKELNGGAVSAGEQLVFDVNQQVNEKGVDITTLYNKFVLTDKLDSKVRFDKAEVLKDGGVLADVKEVSYDEKTHTVAFTGSADFLKTMSMKKETYTLRIYATVIDEIAEGQVIKNIANSIVNDTNKDTNETTNPIKVPKGAITVKKVTDQVVGVKAKVDDSEPQKEEKNTRSLKEEPFDKVTEDEHLDYEALPQAGVTYELSSAKAITYGNGDVIVDENQVIAEGTTDELGLATFDDLYEGEYKLQEISAPVGIQIDPEPIYVTLKAENSSDDFVEQQTNHKDPLQETKFTFTKFFEDESGSFNVGEGAKFGLYYATDYKIDDESVVLKDTLIAEMESNEDGLVSYQGRLIPNQLYAIKEISTREGYQLSNSVYYYQYNPVNNDAVNTVELFENGYVENDKFYNYPTLENLEVKESNEEKQNIQNLIIKENSIVKEIEKSDGERVTSYDILKDKEIITFTGTVYIGDNNDLTSGYVVSDKLPEGFRYKSVKVFDGENKDITNHVTVNGQAQDVSFAVSGDYAKDLKRTMFTFKIETEYNHKEEYENKEFENQMFLHIGKSKFDSNVVKLKAPTIAKEQEKDEPSIAEKLLPKTGEEKAVWGVAIGVVLLAIVGAVFVYKKRQVK
jgi:fimbrial isopeptide formation D2 family protein/LPXTG-motif cell wall-anchored protein